MPGLMARDCRRGLCGCFKGEGDQPALGVSGWRSGWFGRQEAHGHQFVRFGVDVFVIAKIVISPPCFYACCSLSPILSLPQANCIARRIAPQSTVAGLAVPPLRMTKRSETKDENILSSEIVQKNCVIFSQVIDCESVFFYCRK